MSSENNSYFLFITHPSAFNGLIAEEATKTKGRYHYTHYNMETVSAFKIMSRKFKIINPDSDEYTRLVHEFYSDKQDMLNLFSTNSTSLKKPKKICNEYFQYTHTLQIWLLTMPEKSVVPLEVFSNF